MRLYEVVQQLSEYNQGATLNKWGERIAQAAKFNRLHLGDNWFTSNPNIMNYDPDSPEADEFISELVLEELESIDPTANKQYVMTLVRWYTAVVKVHEKNKKLYAKLRKAELEGGTADDWEPGYNEIWPEDYTDLGKGDDYQGAGYVTARATEDWNIDDAEFDLDKIGTQSSFKLEDVDQIRDALVRFESIKQQLPANERDIGRYKNFYRFEDYVDSVYDENYVPPETDNETLKRSDVEVLYNGPLGTVTIPRSHEASCELGSGTKWCTTGKNSYWYDSYSSQGDLIIYNEKPGNAKYQLHVTLKGIEARDARDRNVPHAKELEFLKHPVLSKIIQAQNDKIFSQMAQQPFTGDTTYGRDPVKLVRTFIEFNNKHQGGVMRYVDEYYVKYAFADIVKQPGRAPGRDFVKLMLTYAKQRGKPWPEMRKLYMEMLYGLSQSQAIIDAGNVGIKTINRLVASLDTLGPNPELEKFKTTFIAQINKQN
jgi:hypothetical protein